MNHNIRKQIRKPLGVLLAACLFLTGCGDLSYEIHKYFNEVFELEDPAGAPVTLEEKKEQISALAEAIREDATLRQPQVSMPEDGNVTVLIYMNGSDLETRYACASEDLTEMLEAGSSDRVNVVIQTMGTKHWSRRYGISSKHSQVYTLGEEGLELVRDDLAQLDCTKEETLRDFIEWGTEQYPADRYILLLWDHGGGPVYGFGYDQFAGYDAALTLDEIKTAVADAGTYFDMIGMDCCVMSCLEVALALYDYCAYPLLSEDFEPFLGWYYTDWMAALYETPSISTPELAKIIIDSSVEANLREEEGDETILALIDETYVPTLYKSWRDFAYANEETLLSHNYSQHVDSEGRVHPLLAKSDDDYELGEYYITDMLAVAENVVPETSAALEAALELAIGYVRTTEGDAYLTGLSVTLPYGDEEFYDSLRPVFLRSGLEEEYIDWLEKFVTASGAHNYYSFDKWMKAWNGAADWFSKLDWYYWEGN